MKKEGFDVFILHNLEVDIRIFDIWNNYKYFRLIK